LPDKAIDLVDEAASRLKMEIESMPFEIDQAERKIDQLEIERRRSSGDRRALARQRLVEVRPSSPSVARIARHAAQWLREKELSAPCAARSSASRGAADLEQASARRLREPGRLQYGELPEAGEGARAARAGSPRRKGGRYLKEEVTDEDIAGGGQVDRHPRLQDAGGRAAASS
jgi:ATP-dependent Clp protease ATP-binding subunit ClpB